MTNQIFIFITNLNHFVWGAPLLLILIGTHVYFTLYLHIPQKNLCKAIKSSVSPAKEARAKGITPFAALSTMLAATLGTGNIVGVSTAVFLGGPGAVFWCWITGVLGMATSYAECYLSLKYRSTDGGGPMYVLKNGLKKKSLGNFYSFFIILGALGMGCTVQSNSVASSVQESFHISPHISGIILSIITGLVILGGIQCVGKICSKLVPIITFSYLAGCLYILIINYALFLPALKLILTDAFSFTSIGGGLLGSTFILSARYGISRGLFSNEAGIGTSSIGAASTNATDLSKNAYIFMTAVFWDTVVMCMITGLVIVTSMLSIPESMMHCSSINMTTIAFAQIPYIGDGFIALSLVAYAITTLIGWSYFGEKGTQFIFGDKSIPFYKFIFIMFIYLGAITPINFVWECSDLINALLVVPNLIALYCLRKKIKIKSSNNFF